MVEEGNTDDSTKSNNYMENMRKKLSVTFWSRYVKFNYFNQEWFVKSYISIFHDWSYRISDEW